MKRHPLAILADVLESEIDALADIEPALRREARKLRMMTKVLARAMRYYVLLVGSPQ